MKNNPGRMGHSYRYKFFGNILFPGWTAYVHSAATSFVFVKYMRGIINQTDDINNKYINRTAVHEIAHARGMNALNE